MQKFVLTKLKNLWSDSLYRNSFWLMAGSFSMAAIGFAYWIIAARLYTPSEIGLATTFLSATTLINNFAMLGFGTTLIRYLPNAKSKEAHINTSFTIVSIAALLLGLLYLMGLQIWTVKLVPVFSSMWVVLLVLMFFPVNALNGITDSVYTSYRQAQWVFVSNIIQSVAKLLALVLFPALGIWGVVGSNMFGISLAVIFCLVSISTLYKHHFRLFIDFDILKEVQRYAVGNYLSGLVGAIPGLILPIIITNRISPEQTAYFYMPNMLASMLIIIPATISRSYFTESSNTNAPVSLKRPITLTFSILIPLVVGLVLFGKYILSLFGSNYSISGYYYLVLVSVSILVSALNYFLGTKLLVQHRLRLLFAVNAIGALANLVLAWILTSRGINGVAIASIFSQLISLLILVIFSNRKI